MAGYNDVLEICLDVDEESDDCILFLGPSDPSTTEPSDTDDMSLCAETKMLWPKFKSKLTEVTVAFLDEFPHPVFDIKKTIKSVVNEWTLGTRISFKFIEDRSKADIRISNRRGGSWSAIGTAARKKSIDKPTMNLDGQV